MARTRFKFDKGHLERMTEAGMGPADIAKVYGCERTTVIHWLRKHGITNSPKVIELSDADVAAAIERHTKHLGGQHYG